LVRIKRGGLHTNEHRNDTKTCSEQKGPKKERDRHTWSTKREKILGVRGTEQAGKPRHNAKAEAHTARMERKSERKQSGGGEAEMVVRD